MMQKWGEGGEGAGNWLGEGIGGKLMEQAEVLVVGVFFKWTNKHVDLDHWFLNFAKIYKFCKNERS